MLCTDTHISSCTRGRERRGRPLTKRRSKELKRGFFWKLQDHMNKEERSRDGNVRNASLEHDRISWRYVHCLESKMPILLSGVVTREPHFSTYQTCHANPLTKRLRTHTRHHSAGPAMTDTGSLVLSCDLTLFARRLF